jgi:hypothetical protein
LEIQELVDQQTQAGPGTGPFFGEKPHSSSKPSAENMDLSPSGGHPALALLDARPDIFARRGSVVATSRRRGTRTYGPYYRLSYRDGGRQQSIYLGRASELVEQVRRKLDALQKPLRQRRAIYRLRRQVSAALRVQKTRLDARLRHFGLRLKGFEVRGWRTTPLRRLWCHMPRFRAPRSRQLRLYPKGPARAALRKKIAMIPSSPQARLEAVLAARRRKPS